MTIKIQTLFATALLLLVGVTAQVDAQTRQRSSDPQIRLLLTSIQTKTDAFKRSADNSTESYNNNREDGISRYITDFENATDALKRGMDNRSNVNSETAEVLNRATVIDSFVRRSRLSASTQRQWESIRTDLNSLASYSNAVWNWNQPVAAGTPTVQVYNVSDIQLRNLLGRIETKTDAFKTQFNSALDRSKWNNTNREDNLDAYVTAFEKSTDRLKQRFEARGSVGTDVSQVLTRAAYIDQFMSRNRLSRQAQMQWSSLRGDLNTLATYYSVSWNWNQTLPPFNPGEYNDGNTGTVGNGTGRHFDARLTGTYRLNTALSDNVASVIDRSVAYYSTDQRDNVRRNLERRLRSPEVIAIEKTGNTVSMASGNASQVTFQADGQPRTETNAQGRTITTTATADREDGFSINYEGERTNDFYASFVPTRDGQLKVTRRIYLENRSDQVTVSSLYDKTDNSAQWPTVYSDPYQTGNNSGGVNRGGFYISNGTQLTASLRNAISTKDSQVNDRFTMEVTSPSEYRGVILEGRVIQADKSGRVSGRANISLDFDTIRMPSGQTYKFAGIIDGATAANGDDIKVNNEGTVRDSNQTTKTVTRAGIGAALGAIIGAVAGGGSGAAVGAAVGAGAGAGTVLVQGRDNIDLGQGSTFRITATAPNNVGAGLR